MCAQRPLCHSKIPTWITHRAPTDCVRGSKQKRVVTQSLAPNRDRADSRGLNCAFGYLAWKLGDPRSISRQRSSPRLWKVSRTLVSVGTDRETGRSRGRSSRWRRADLSARCAVLVDRDKRMPALFHWNRDHGLIFTGEISHTIPPTIKKKDIQESVVKGGRGFVIFAL